MYEKKKPYHFVFTSSVIRWMNFTSRITDWKIIWIQLEKNKTNNKIRNMFTVATAHSLYCARHRLRTPKKKKSFWVQLIQSSKWIFAQCPPRMHIEWKISLERANEPDERANEWKEGKSVRVNIYWIHHPSICRVENSIECW